MIASMTGYGRGEVGSEGVKSIVELRSVNSRFLEISTRLPRSLSSRESEIKEIIRKRISRGKINMVAVVERSNESKLPLRINLPAARAYQKLLLDLRKAIKSREPVRLEHLLRFPEVIEGEDLENTDDKEWSVVARALEQASENLLLMRKDEGGELSRDFKNRIAALEQKLADIDRISKVQVSSGRMKLRERIQQLMEDHTIDEGRLEMEIAFLADRLDVTEECVRFRSHNKFFLETMNNGEPAGRKLNFLVQEMNREANTIGSKSSSSEIAHIVVNIKEELEKIREQLQNIE